MALNSLQFIIAFFAFFLVYLILDLVLKKTEKIGIRKIQIIALLLFSYYFIYTFDWRFCICTMGITVYSYILARVINKTLDARIKKTVLVIAIVGLLVTLGYFKYTNFFLEEFSIILRFSYEIRNIILPIGISFYVFSALSYVIDVYKDNMEAEKSFLNYALYISFFPKLTAGPIVRAKAFLTQLKGINGLTIKNFSEGIQIFVFGLFKKIVLADHLAIFVGDVFYAPVAYNTGTVWLAIISYSLQIYFDFSGYSDMAIGISKILGFDFLPNFNLPYIARGFSDFWKRWHISLSSWFMDYLYIPLGGSRKGNKRTYCNLIVVMLISGIWHGAGLTFIVWGLLHGVASCIERFLKSHKIQFPTGIQVTFTYIIVSLFWVFFRANNIKNAVAVWKAAFTIHTGISQPFTWAFFAMICYIVALFVAVHHSTKEKMVDKQGRVYINGFYPLMNLNNLVALILFFTFCGLTVLMGYFGNTAFIYGAF